MTPLAATEAERLERERFEAWCFSLGLMEESYGLRSESSHCKTAWLAWQAAIALQNTPESVRQVTAGKGEIVTCAGKGGTYQHIGVAMGAGTMRGEQDLDVYGDKATGLIYYRTRTDYRQRMLPIAAPDRAPSTAYSDCCDTPHLCSAVRRCTAKDGAPSTDSAADAREKPE